MSVPSNVDAPIALVVSAAAFSGGANTYESGLLRQIEASPGAHRFTIISVGSHRLSPPKAGSVRILDYKERRRSRLGCLLRSSVLGVRLLEVLGFRYSAFERFLIQAGIEVVYFVSPTPLTLSVTHFPVVNTVWDVGHLDLPMFPELSGGRFFVDREYFFRKIIPRSSLIVVDSDALASKVCEIYGFSRHRCLILPFEALIQNSGDYSPDRSGADNNFGSSSQKFPVIIYPAQFWPHKRHLLLLRAFKLLLEVFPDAQLILTGSDKGNLSHIVNWVGELGISESVQFLGFVDYSELLREIAGADLLVFPSDLGPTNLPPLEALKLGTRSLVSVAHEFSPWPEGCHRVPQQTADAWAEQMMNCLRMEPLEPRVSCDQFSLEVAGVISRCSELLDLVEEWGGIKARFQRKD